MLYKYTALRSASETTAAHAKPLSAAMCSAAAAFLVLAAEADAASRKPASSGLSALPPLSSVWRADQLDRSATVGDGAALQRATGHAALDAELPGGGWPAAGLTELLLAAPGGGELWLLAPSLSERSLLWIAPPFLPYAPALAALGLALDRLTVVTPETATDAAWAAEQALRSGALGAVLWWEVHGRAFTLPATLRRLHLASMEGRTPLFALRPAAVRVQSSPAPLRLALEPAAASTLAVDVFKRRGPPMAAPLVLTLPAPALLPSRRRRRAAASLEQEAADHALVRPAPAGVAA
jgi:protein ImuA